MKTSRLEAFSDGVIAIIITIMVLEIGLPRGSGFHALGPLLPLLLSYVLSFVYVGIYWNNHHHVFQATKRVNGKILWANLHLLFWLSLIPLATRWIGEYHAAAWPAACYGVVLLMAGIAYNLLEQLIVRDQGSGSALARAVGREFKGWGSVALYLAAIGLAFVRPGVSEALYALVALVWIVPDRRIERILTE
ncbi:MAG TPA: TMEM175 family protein [Gammaproteobacteria bacterium]|nr:TMEM175 family protein [Gammaproteobacteria bacterium]